MFKVIMKLVLVILFSSILVSCSEEETQIYDTVIINGVIFDGLGGEPYEGGIAIKDGKIAAIGDVVTSASSNVINADGKAITPGFINMLSWSVNSIIEDGRSMGDIMQGVTLEVFGEGNTGGPLSPKQKAEIQADQNDIKYEITWDSFGGWLEYMEAKGVATNVASFVGATTIRINHIGYENRAPTPEELALMEQEVRNSMEEGAIGVGSSLIYAPAFYAKTRELIALNKAASPYGGMYISHIRSEGSQFLEAIDELITIAREANVPAEIYHLKAGGKENWYKMDQAIAMVEAARSEGLGITADMYTYVAGATGLDAYMPPWVQEGGFKDWATRLKDPEIRAKLVVEMNTPTNEWENLGLSSGPEGMLLLGFKNPDLKKYIGKTLSEVAAERGMSPQETAMDLVIEDGTRVGTAYFLMSEENIAKQIKLPWLSFGSDGSSMAPEGVFIKNSTHPRSYGNFTRLLAKYVRDEKIIPLKEAIRKLSHLPATNMKLRERGSLQVGYYADVLVFDPADVQDHATFQEPHQLSTGMSHVFVNGVQVVYDGLHTGATPGQFVRGPGWTGWKK
ncbi:MAG: N-acyl-D-amino-acid deacylase family protein [Sphingomonadales bacterium]